jgi:hypothetical protein
VQARGEKGKGSQPITYEAMAYGSVGVVMHVLITSSLNHCLMTPYLFAARA